MPLPMTNGLFTLGFWPCRVILCHGAFPLLVKRHCSCSWTVSGVAPERARSRPRAGWGDVRPTCCLDWVVSQIVGIYTHEKYNDRGSHATRRCAAEVLNSLILCYLFVLITSPGLETGYWKAFHTIKSLILVFNKVFCVIPCGTWEKCVKHCPMCKE